MTHRLFPCQHTGYFINPTISIKLNNRGNSPTFLYPFFYSNMLRSPGRDLRQMSNTKDLLSCCYIFQFTTNHSGNTAT